MNYLTLELIKKHLVLEDDFNDDDMYLEHLADVVEVAVEKNIDDSFECIQSDNGGVFPSPLKQAMLLLIGVFYNNREAVSFGTTGVEVPLQFNYLIDLYRNYGTGKDAQMAILNDIQELLKKQQESIETLASYVEQDAKKAVTQGNGISISGDLDKTISVGNIDLGEY